MDSIDLTKSSVVQETSLFNLVQDWIVLRRQTINEIEKLADELQSANKHCHIAKATGSAISVAGTSVAAVGFALSFFTFGSSLIVTAVGAGIGALGGATAGGSGIAEICIERSIFKAANLAIQKEAETIRDLSFYLQSKLSVKMDETRAALSSILIIHNVSRGVGMGIWNGIRLGESLTTAAKIAQASGTSAFQTLGTVGRVGLIGGFVASAALLPLDIYTFFTSTVALQKGKVSDAVLQLRELAKSLGSLLDNGAGISSGADSISESWLSGELSGNARYKSEGFSLLCGDEDEPELAGKLLISDTNSEKPVAVLSMDENATVVMQKPPEDVFQPKAAPTFQLASAELTDNKQSYTNVQGHKTIDHNTTDHKITDHKITDHNITDHKITDHNITDHNITDHKITDHNLNAYNSDFNDVDIDDDDSILTADYEKDALGEPTNAVDPSDSQLTSNVVARLLGYLRNPTRVQRETGDEQFDKLLDDIDQWVADDLGSVSY